MLLFDCWLGLAGSAEALAEQVTQENFDRGLIFPPFTNIRKISAHIAAKVAAKAYELGKYLHAYIHTYIILFLPLPRFRMHQPQQCLSETYISASAMQCAYRFGEPAAAAGRPGEVRGELHVHPHLPQLPLSSIDCEDQFCRKESIKFSSS